MVTKQAMTHLHATAWMGVVAVPWAEGVGAGHRGGTAHPLYPVSADPACASCLAQHGTMLTNGGHNDSDVCL